MHPKYPNVFSPIKLGRVEVENRFYFAPHGVGLALNNEPSSDFAYYSAERAHGGCGLVIHSLNVHGKVMQMSSPFPEANVKSFTAMAEQVHAGGAKAFGQLWYFWAQPGPWVPLSPPRPTFSPSAVQMNGSYSSTRALRASELKDIVEAYGQSAANLRRAGYDGIELHVSHGTILEQFLSPYFNHRTDGYGGSLDNRLRMVFECLEAVRASAGPDMAIGIRFNCDEMLPGGYDQDDAGEILQRISESGLLDFVDLDVAVEPNQLYLGMPSVFVEKHPYRPFVEAVRSAAGKVPVLSVLGRLTTIAEAEAALAAGVCDMVGAARALIAEPYLVNNARDGKEEQSRECIACNWCLEARIHGAAGCAINPASYRERRWGRASLETSDATPSKVVIVGGGPGGLEAARIAAIRGHRVVLIESRDALGGALLVWSGLPGREWFANAIDWWTRELARLNVEVRLGTEATAESVLAESPDAVILATGGRYVSDGRSGFNDNPIPGFDKAHVLTPEDVLLKGERPTGRVVIFDCEGIHTGVGIAEVLGAAGADVTLVSPHFSPVLPNYNESLPGTMELTFLVRRLAAAGVTIEQRSFVHRIDDDAVVLADRFTGDARTIEDVDAVVLVTARLPYDPLADGLEGRVGQLFTIGDALATRPMATAPYEGQMFARLVGVPGAPTTFAEAYWPEPELMHAPRPAAVLLELTAPPSA